MNEKNAMDTQTQEEIQKNKESIFKEIGITPERQDELSIVAQDTMSFLKEKLKTNGINLDIERAFICDIIHKKNGMLRNIYYLSSINPTEEKKDE